VKSEEFIKEAGIMSKVGGALKSVGNALKPVGNLGFGYEKPDYPGSTGQATGVLGRLASDLVGADNYAATAQALGATGRPKDAPIKDLAKDTAAQIRSNPAVAAQMVNTPGHNVPSAFQQQFQLVDDNPPTVQYKNTTFQRDQYGKWIDFRSGKEVPDRFADVLDKISPAPTTAPASQMPLMSPPLTKSPTAPGPTAPTAGSLSGWQTGPTASTQQQAKAKIARMPDGGVVVTDKMGKKWTKPSTGDYWADESGAIFRPASQEYQKLSDFTQNLKESLGRKRR
jgi:hypothetical protein